LFPDALPHFYEAVGHDGAHGEEVVGWAEATGGEVTLVERRVSRYTAFWGIHKVPLGPLADATDVSGSRRYGRMEG